MPQLVENIDELLRTVQSRGPYAERALTYDVLGDSPIYKRPVPPPPEPVDLQGPVDWALSPIHAGLRLGAGLAGWPVGAVAGLGSGLGERLAGGTPEEARDAFRNAMQKYSTAVSDFLSPQLPNVPGERAAEIAGMGIEKALSGVRQVANVEGDLYKGLGLKPLSETHPFAAEIAGLASELMAFKAAHVAGSKLKGMYVDRMTRAQALRNKPASSWTDADKEFFNSFVDELREAKKIGQGPQRLLEAPGDFLDAEFTVKEVRQLGLPERALPAPQLRLPYEGRPTAEPGEGIDLALPSAQQPKSVKKFNIVSKRAGEQLGYKIRFDGTVEQEGGLPPMHNFTFMEGPAKGQSFSLHRRGRVSTKAIARAGEKILKGEKEITKKDLLPMMDSLEAEKALREIVPEVRKFLDNPTTVKYTPLKEKIDTIGSRLSPSDESNSMAVDRILVAMNRAIGGLEGEGIEKAPPIRPKAKKEGVTKLGLEELDRISREARDKGIMVDVLPGRRSLDGIEFDDISVDYITHYKGRGRREMFELLDDVFKVAADNDRGVTAMAINPKIGEAMGVLGGEQSWAGLEGGTTGRWTISPERVKQIVQEGGLTKALRRAKNAERRARQIGEAGPEETLEGQEEGRLRARDLEKDREAAQGEAAEGEVVPEKVFPEWENAMDEQDFMSNEVGMWLVGEAEKPVPRYIYRGVPKGANLDIREGYTHGTPWPVVAARGGKGAFGDPRSYDVYRVKAPGPDALYYRGGSLEGDPLESTRIGSPQGVTWSEALDQAKQLYYQELTREAARSRTVDRQLDSGDKKWIFDKVVEEFVKGTMELDLSGRPGIWTGRAAHPELSKKTPPLRSHQDLLDAVDEKRLAGYEDADIPEIDILKRAGQEVPEPILSSQIDYFGGEEVPRATPKVRDINHLKQLFDELRKEETTKKPPRMTKEEVRAAFKSRKDVEDFLDEPYRNNEEVISDTYDGVAEDWDLGDYSPGKIAKDLFDVFRDERGSFSNKKLSPEDLKKIDKLRRKARDMGRQIGELLREMGIDPEAIKNIEEVVKELWPENRLEDPTIRRRLDQYWARAPKFKGTFKSGDRGYDVYEPGVLASELKAMQKAPELKEGFFGGAFDNPIRVFEKLGELKDILYDKWRVGQHQANVEKLAYKDKLKELREGLTRRERLRIGTYAVGVQPGTGPKILEAMKIKALPKLSTHEMEVYLKLRSEYEKLFHRVNEARAGIGKRPIKYVDNYFTFMRAFSFMDRMGLRHNPVLEGVDRVMSEYAKYKATIFPYAKVRVKLSNGYPVELDPFRIFERYSNMALDHIHVSPTVAKTRAFLRGVKDPETGKVWMAKFNKPHMEKFLREWSNYIAGDQPIRLPRKIKSALDMLNRNVAVAVMSYNARSAGIQLTALRNTYAEIGTQYTLRGLLDILDPTNYRSAMDKSKVLLSRNFDASAQEFFNSIREGKVGAVKGAVGKAGMWPLRALDMLSARATWNGAYRLATEKLGMSEPHAVRYADDVVTKTQASGAKGDIAPIQRSSLGRMLTMFQTFVINDWNFLMRDVVGVGGKPTRANIGKAFRYLLATTLINTFFEDVMGIKSPFPRPIKQLIKSGQAGENYFDMAVSLAKEAVEPLPILSSLRYGKSPFGAGAELVHGVVTGGPYKQTLADDISKLIDEGKITLDNAQRILTLMGVPGTSQIMKSVRAGQRGETAWGTLMGTYTETPSANLRGSRKSLLKKRKSIR